MGRIYVPRRRVEDRVDALVAVEVHLRSSVATHAIIVLGLAEPDPVVTPQVLSTAYRRSEWWLAKLLENYPAEAEWHGGRKAHPNHLPLTDRLWVKAWKLTDMTDEDAVEKVLTGQLRVWSPAKFPAH